MRYINKYATSSEVQTDLDNGLLGKPYVVYIEQDNMLDWNSKEKVDYTERMLTFNILSGGTIVWKASSTAYTTTISYSKDSGATWTDITATTGGTSISVNPGDVVQFKGDNATYSSGSSYYNSFSGSTAKFSVEGNAMSLIDSTGFATATTLASSYTFYNLFSSCTGLTSAENLVLPATTLANFCYQYMFSNCTSLTTAPELPATTLAVFCYDSMFSGCTSLNYIKCLATYFSAYGYTYGWVSGVAATGTFVKNINMTGWGTGVSGIPTGWTVVDSE